MKLYLFSISSSCYRNCNTQIKAHELQLNTTACVKTLGVKSACLAKLSAVQTQHRDCLRHLYSYHRTSQATKSNLNPPITVEEY